MTLYKKTKVVEKLTKREKRLLVFLFILIASWSLYKVYSPNINLLLKRKRQLIQIKQIINTPKTDLGSKIINNDGLPEFIVSIEKTCKKNKIKLLSITPLYESEQNINSLTTEIKVKGTLSNILCFLTDLYESKMALTIQNITLTTNQDSSSNTWFMSAKIDLYYQD